MDDKTSQDKKFEVNKAIGEANKLEPETLVNDAGNREVTGRSKEYQEQQFKPGQSGNPKGRPKGKSLTSLLKTVMDSDIELNDIELRKGKKSDLTVRKQEQMEAYLELRKRGFKKKDLMLAQLSSKAGKGDLSAINMVLDRTEGKPAQVNTNLNTDVTYEAYLDSIAKD